MGKKKQRSKKKKSRDHKTKKTRINKKQPITQSAERSSTEPLGQPTVEKASRGKALVDIITPVYGSPNLLMGTIASIYLHPTDIPWHWWIIDDCTPDDKGKILLHDIYQEISKDPNVDVLLNSQNLGFAGANNAAVQQGNAPYIMLLNSDVRVTDQWLRPMVEEMESNYKAGVVGAKLIFFPEVHKPFRDGTNPRPAGKVQHAGVAFNILRQPFHIHIGWKHDNPRLDKRKSLQAVTGAALLTRRALWEKTGGLDLVYTQGNFEDIEYCLRVKDMGFEIIYRPDAVIYHYAGGSGNSLTALRNAQIFLMRCGQAIISDEHRLY